MAKKSSAAAVTVRFANGARKMAKKKGGHRKSPRRKNPTHHGKKRHHGRRRRNPSSGGFGARLGRLALGAAAVVASGVATTVAMSKIEPGTSLSMYGVPAVVALSGVAIAGKMPMLGGGLALGAATPFVLPLASRAIQALAPATPAQTAAGISAALRGRAGMLQLPMGAVQMGAVQMGAVQSRYAY